MSQSPDADSAGPDAEPVVAASSAKGEVEVVELSRSGQSTARRVAESKAIVPHLYLAADADLTAAEALLATGGAGLPALVVAATARALREHPEVNCAYRDGRVERYSRINVGWLVPDGDAVVVATLFDADGKDLEDIDAELDALAAAVADGTITPPQLSGGTFTVTDLGAGASDAVVPVVNPPQAASLGVGTPRQEAVVRDGEVVAGRRLALRLSCDHRAVHAHAASSFLARLRDLIAEPAPLAD